MVGLELPVLAMEHMYLLTEDMPEVIQFNESSGLEVPHAVDFDGELYLRQERKGMLMGTYEKACKPWSPKQTPWDFGHELLPDDLDKIDASHRKMSNSTIKKILADAEKEFDPIARYGYGAEEGDEARDTDFSSVRGTFVDNSFVQQMQGRLRDDG